MKINGQIVTPNEELLVLPRSNGDLIIKAKAVAINADFDALVPEPVAPGIRTRDGFKPDENDETYREALSRRSQQRFDYVILRSLEPSNIEWETVSIDDPTTWSKWSTEMQNAGMAEAETNRIIMCVLAANSLDDDKIKAARETFLLGQVE